MWFNAQGTQFAWKSWKLCLQLSKEGWEFVGFEHLENEERKLKEKQDAEFDNLKITNQLNRWLIKTRWLPLIISLIALLISLYSVLFEKDKKENKNLKNRIEKLEMTLKNKNHR